MARPTDIPKAKPREVVALSPQQEAAILALLSGQRYKEAADTAGVAPETLSRWLSGDAAFVAELNARRASLWQGHRDRISQLVGQALDTLGELLECDNPHLRLRAAHSILKAAALDSGAPPAGPTNPEAVEKRWFLDEQESKLSALDMLASGDW